ncbi:pilus assembly protein FlpE [Myceligenerans pegani]|uniref:Pilus assembly protein FlpE n=1 Tax=Myceligenerans pegani TaxID=2776917 RepID=A0ABR9MZW6_9MICO|nr:pilus assembly protein FlpE [Myceligenerans sp. TRM 65318]MBE1876942.1 pilus assembly protein FlpE [Myceligenerans sp. TRM 65318]MBE3019213.1 pilus assembly protein FlpE [Myceligenerans sp. TRM 65318]
MGRYGRVIAVTGAIGGVGTTVAAAAAALGLIGRGEPAALVDLDADAPGIELLLGIEDVRGARWPELSAARGDVDGETLVAALPSWRDVPVVSGRRRAGPPSDDVVLDVCAGIVRSGRALVLDLPRPSSWTGAARALLGGCDTAVLVTPLTFPGAAGAELVRDQLVAAGVRDVRVVARGPAPGQVDPDALGAALGLPVDGMLERDRSVPAAIERGDGLPAGRGAVARLAANLGAAL